MAQNRINWLDTSRGIAFLMVIYSHLDYCNSDIMKYFSPIFLTTFFFISGYLFKEKQSFGKVLEQRTRTLLLPFLLLGMLMIVLSPIITFNVKVTLEDAVMGLLLQNGDNQILWFIAALYVYSLFFYWIERFCKNHKVLLIVSFVLFFLNTCYIYWLNGPKIPWHLNHVGFACFYMGLGKVYKDYEFNIDRYIDTKKLLTIALVYVIIITLIDKGYSFGGSKWGVDAIIVTSLGLLLCVYWAKLCAGNNRFFLFIGANTLFYFAFHGKVYSLLQTITAKLFILGGFNHYEALDTIVGFIITMLDAIILILPAMFVNRYVPWLLGKGFKLW